MLELAPGYASQSTFEPRNTPWGVTTYREQPDQVLQRPK